MGCCLSLACCACEGACCLGRGLCACCPSSGDDGKKAANPDAGRTGSMWVMVLAMALSLLMQYYVAKYMDFYAWTCDDDDAGCKGAAAVYRVSLCTCLFFAAMAAGTYASPAFHDSYWGSKFLGWVVLLVVSVFVPNEVFDDHGYLWVARVGGFVFVVLQQVLLIDLAYYMNDSLVTLADSGEVSEWCGMPSPLVALIAAAAALFLVAVVGVGLLFAYFGTDCTSPDTILGLTVALCVVATACQLFISKDSNLLTSATVSAYLVYLAASALTANPVPSCNPFYSNTSDWLSIVVGLAFTIAALVYTIYSASNNVQYLGGGRGDAGKASDNGPGGAMMNKILTGQLEGSAAPADKSYGSNGAAGDEERPAAPPEEPDGPPKTPAEVASFNLVMALMACNIAMVLTNWGSITKSGSAASPSSGQVAMWMQAAAQWTAGLLYVWTCVAPTLFPDRDFS